MLSYMQLSIMPLSHTTSMPTQDDTAPYSTNQSLTSTIPNNNALYSQGSLNSSSIHHTSTHNHNTPFPNSLQSSNPSHSPLTFTITKAHIRESLESPFSIECEGYIESMQEQLIAL